MNIKDTDLVLGAKQIGHCADKYLKVYVADINWEPHIKTLWSHLSRKKENAVTLRNVIAATILLPYVEPHTKIDSLNPESLLLKMFYYDQFRQRDWFELFMEIVNKDQIIEEQRIKLLELGVISKIKYDPISRQAFNWLYQKAEETHAITDSNKAEVVERFTNLVMAYGGASICNIFSRHKDKLPKVINWRTGYFFEKVLHDTYSFEDLVKIKKADLERANPSLVRKLVGV